MDNFFYLLVGIILIFYVFLQSLDIITTLIKKSLKKFFNTKSKLKG